MDMKRIEAPTLEEAYRKASEAFSCSITEINYQIVQYPTGGVMGLFKKPAIIVAVRKVASTPAPAPTPQEEQEKIIEEKPTVEETQPTTSKEP